MKVLIKNGLVVRSDGSAAADVLTEDGRIKRIAPSIDEPADRVIDAAGCWVMAGFIAYAPRS